MKLYQMTIDEIPHGFATFVKAADKGEVIAKSECGVQTALIQMVGRFTEFYASDLFCTLSEMNAFIANQPEESGHWVIPVGIREMGVDHDTMILSRLKDTQHGIGGYVSTRDYRKILAIVIDVEEKPWGFDTEFTLVDITHDIYKIDPEDEEE